MKKIYKKLYQDAEGEYFIIGKNGNKYINTQEALLLIYLIEVLISK